MEQEEAKYDMEMKIRKQDYEVCKSDLINVHCFLIKILILKINELTIKVNDIKGKFIKPALKKVNKTQSK